MTSCKNDRGQGGRCSDLRWMLVKKIRKLLRGAKALEKSNLAKALPRRSGAQKARNRQWRQFLIARQVEGGVIDRANGRGSMTGGRFTFGRVQGGTRPESRASAHLPRAVFFFFWKKKKKIFALKKRGTYHHRFKCGRSRKNNPSS